MMIGLYLTGLMAILGFAGETPLGKFLHRMIAERPAEALNELNGRSLWMAIVLMVVVGAYVLYGQTENFRLIAMGLPDLLPWIMTVEIGTVLDVLALLAATSAFVRFRPLRVFIAAYLAKLLPRRRTARPRTRRGRVRRAKPTSADSEDDGFLPQLVLT